MSNILKSIFFKLSYNLMFRKIAKKVFVYFPKLKYKLIKLRDSGYSAKSNPKKYTNKNDFLESIKLEIESIKMKRGN